MNMGNVDHFILMQAMRRYVEMMGNRVRVQILYLSFRKAGDRYRASNGMVLISL